MRILFALLLVLCLGGPVAAQTFYNPNELQFEDVNFASAVKYRAEFLVAGTTTPVVAFADVPVVKVTVASPGPPVTYSLLFKDIPVFLPFGKNYVIRLLRCDTTDCGTPSEVTREFARYTYCKSGPNSVTPITISTTQMPCWMPSTAFAPLAAPQRHELVSHTRPTRARSIFSPSAEQTLCLLAIPTVARCVFPAMARS